MTGTSFAELPLGAVRTVEDDLGRVIVGEVRLPASLIAGQPDLPALSALRNESDFFSHGVAA
jgi:hypothetical protein